MKAVKKNEPLFYTTFASFKSPLFFIFKEAVSKASIEISR